MLKSNSSWYVLLAVAAISPLIGGCNQSAETETNVELTSVSAVAGMEGGCCGNCATEQVTAGLAGDCCGKCSGEAGTAAKSAGCCGKCEGEQAVVSTSVAAAKGECEAGCNACAEGDSANCKCGDAPAKAASDPAEGDRPHVNSMPEDRDIFHALLDNHEKITRKVTELEDGVQTVTESSDPAIVGKIQEHVSSMYKRVEDGRPLRMWDELYQEIFKHADKIKMEIENTEHGISVTETSEDPYVVKLIQAHAKVVSGFAERGFEEAHQNHVPPAK